MHDPFLFHRRGRESIMQCVEHMILVRFGGGISWRVTQVYNSRRYVCRVTSCLLHKNGQLSRLIWLSQYHTKTGTRRLTHLVIQFTDDSLISIISNMCHLRSTTSALLLTSKSATVLLHLGWDALLYSFPTHIWRNDSFMKKDKKYLQWVIFIYINL